VAGLLGRPGAAQRGGRPRPRQDRDRGSAMTPLRRYPPAHPTVSNGTGAALAVVAEAGA
jgi:hypothetical protein